MAIISKKIFTVEQLDYLFMINRALWDTVAYASAYVIVCLII